MRLKEIQEWEATGDVERVYHEIRQTLRVSGVNLAFRVWAGYPKALPMLWDAMAANVETRFFEEAADELRREAVLMASKLGQVTTPSVQIGASQRHQIQCALTLYHYVNPKVLLFTAAVARALEHPRGPVSEARPVDHIERVERGVPERMYPMEMIDLAQADRRVRRIFSDIQETLSLSLINSDYRTLALWPDYLEAAWTQLKPIALRADFREASERLRQHARALASSLPFPVSVSREELRRKTGRADQIADTTSQFERLLPPLILNVTLLALEWHPAEQVMRSPYPARTRSA